MIEAKGISIDAFADSYGIARSTAHNWLNLARPPLQKHWKPLSEFFGVSENYVAHGRYVLGSEKPTSYEVAESPAPYEKSPLVRGPAVTAASGRVDINPAHAPRPSEPTEQQCIDYFLTYLSQARQTPGGLGVVMWKLQKQFPHDDFETGKKP